METSLPARSVPPRSSTRHVHAKATDWRPPDQHSSPAGARCVTYYRHHSFPNTAFESLAARAADTRLPPRPRSRPVAKRCHQDGGGEHFFYGRHLSISEDNSHFMTLPGCRGHWCLEDAWGTGVSAPLPDRCTADEMVGRGSPGPFSATDSRRATPCSALGFSSVFCPSVAGAV